MDTNFNTVIYQLEMLSLVNTAIKKLKAEHPDYEVFTMSLKVLKLLWQMPPPCLAGVLL